jgi:ABC-type lipoprotein export system ATPase subunit/cell division protein FtsX
MLQVIDLEKTYKSKQGQQVKALDKVSIKFPERGLVFILGKSGSGKSTLLNVLGGLDSVDDGEIIIKGKSSKNFSQKDFDSYRNTYLGFIFQEYNILNEFSVYENIALAIELQGKKPSKKDVMKILTDVELNEYAYRKPNELSGGQKQRVAIARALVKNPQIILADEPTGALDSKTGIQIFDTLKNLSKDKLIIVVSHDRDFAEIYGDRIIEIKDGQILSDESKELALSKSENEGISIVDNVISIKKGYKLKEEDVELINNAVALDGAIVVTNVLNNKKLKDDLHLTDNLDKEIFVKTDESKIILNNDKFKLIKSRLPLKKSIKMGLSSLKNKPFRLFLTIFLTAIALTIFGIIFTMSNYSAVNTVKDGISARDYKYGMVRFNEANYDDEDPNKIRYYNDSSFTYERANEFKKFNLDYDLLYSQSSYSGLQAPFVKSAQGLYANYLIGGVEYSKSTLDKCGYTIIKGEEPTKINEVLITDYLVHRLMKYGMQVITPNRGTINLTPDAQNESEKLTEDKIVGQRINNPFQNYSNEPLIIKGIVSTNIDYSIYSQHINKDEYQIRQDNPSVYNQVNYKINKGYPNVLFISPKLAEKFKNDTTISNYKNEYVSVNIPFNGQGGSQTYNTSRFNKVDSIDTNNIIYKKGYNKLSHGEALMSLQRAYDLIDKSISIPEYEYVDYYMYYDSSTNSLVVNKNTSTQSDFYSYSDAYARKNLYKDGFDNYETLKNDEMFKLVFKSSYRYDSYDDDKWISHFLEDKDLNNKDVVAYMYYYLMSGSSLDLNRLAEISPFTNSEDVINYLDNLRNNTPYGKSYNMYRNEANLKLFKDNNLVDTINLESQDALSIDSYNNNSKRTYPIKIVGVYMQGDDSKNDELILSLEDYNLIKDYASGKYSSLLFRYNSVDDTTKLLEESYSKELPYKFNFQNEASESIDSINELVEIFTGVLLYVAIALAIFAMLLLTNFISTSIVYKRREIGILRAVGATSNDVFKIFWTEAFTIAIINFILASIACFISIMIMNKSLSKELFIIGNVFNFGVLSFGSILVIAIVTAFIASFIPVYHLARKKPIDTIKNA